MSKGQVDEIQALIEGSGNNFQCKVAQYFISKGWKVLLSPYYVDASTDKAREIDLIIEKRWHFNSGAGDGYDTIRVRLVVECKWSGTQKSVFWFSTMDEEKAKELISTGTIFRPTNNLIIRHHYLSVDDRVAKLFATQSARDDADPIFRTLNQCLNGYIGTFRRSPLIPVDQLEENHVEFRYPIVVFSSFDNFYQTSVEDSSTYKKIDKRFLCEVDYAHPIFRAAHPDTRYFLIDMIPFNQLDQFLADIEQEVQAARVFLG